MPFKDLNCLQIVLMVWLSDNFPDKALKHKVGYYFIQVASSLQPVASRPYRLFKLSG